MNFETVTAFFVADSSELEQNRSHTCLPRGNVQSRWSLNLPEAGGLNPSQRTEKESSGSEAGKQNAQTSGTLLKVVFVLEPRHLLRANPHELLGTELAHSKLLVNAHSHYGMSRNEPAIHLQNCLFTNLLAWLKAVPPSSNILLGVPSQLDFSKLNFITYFSSARHSVCIYVLSH